MNRQRIIIRCLLAMTVLIALAIIWQSTAGKSGTYPLQAGETIGLGMQGLHATNVPRGVSQVYLNTASISDPVRSSDKTDLKLRAPALEVRFLDGKGGEVERISALVYVYFKIGRAERVLWQKGGMDEIAIWYAGEQAGIWERCRTFFVAETGGDGIVGRLACLASGSGFYALEREVVERPSRTAGPTPTPTTTPTITPTPTSLPYPSPI